MEIGASRPAVDAAYCRLIELWHPDRAATGGPDAIREAQRRVEDINAAYYTLAKIAPNSVESATPASAQNPEPAAPKLKPKLPPLSANYLAGLPPAPKPPPAESWNAPPASQPAARTPTVPPFAPPSDSAPPPPPKAPSPLPFSPLPTPAAPTPVAPVQQATVPAAGPRAKVPGLYDSLLPAGSSARRFAPVVLAVIVVLLLGKCVLSSASRNKSASASDSASAAAPDPKTTGRLIVKSNLAGATIEATRLPSPDDASTSSVSGSVDQALSGLTPGKYAITARADKWPEIHEEVSVAAERTTEVTMNFKGGSLRLDSDPTGAKVRLGADMIGKTPLVIPQLPPGEPQLFLEYPFWPAVPFKVTITENVEATATIRLPHGKVTVETTPPGTTVLLAGRTLGQTPLTLEQFPAGTRKLTLQAKNFPAMEVTVNLPDRGEIKLHPTLGSIFPVLDPAAVMRAIWVPDQEDKIAPPNDGITGPSQPRNGVVKNLNRKWLYQNWLDKRYQFSGIVKSYDQSKGEVEFVEQATPLSKYRVVAILSPEARADTELGAQLVKKGATFAFYGRLSAVEEPRWPFKVITFELSSSEALR